MGIVSKSQVSGGGPFDLLEAGVYAPFNAFNGTNNVAAVANRGFVQRLVAPRTMVITALAFALKVAASVNDPCDVGIYNSTLGTLLGSAGSTAGKLNGALTMQTVPLSASVTINAGTIYYAAFAWGTVGGTAAQVAGTGLDSNMNSAFGAAAPNVLQGFRDGVFPLPAAFGALGGALGVAPDLALLQ